MSNYDNFDAGPSRSASCSDAAMEFMAVRDIIGGLQGRLEDHYMMHLGYDSYDAEDEAIYLMDFLYRSDLSFDEARLVFKGVINGIVSYRLADYGIQRD